MTEDTRQETIQRAAAGLAETLASGHTHAGVYLAELIKTDQGTGALFWYAQRLARELGGLAPNEVYQAMIRAATVTKPGDAPGSEQAAANMERNAITWDDPEAYRYQEGDQ